MSNRLIILSEEEYRSSDSETDKITDSYSNSDESYIKFIPSLANITEQDLDHAIKKLAHFHEVPIDNVHSDVELSQCYHLTKWVDSIWSGTHDHSKLDRVIYKQYRPTSIKPKTVGAFLFGCYQTTYGDVPKECFAPEPPAWDPRG